MNPVITQRVIVMDMVLLLPMGAPPATERAPQENPVPEDRGWLQIFALPRASAGWWGTASQLEPQAR